MPHSNKRNKKNNLPETEHCRMNDVIDAIYFQIKANWISEDEFEMIYKKIKRKLKESKSND